MENFTGKVAVVTGGAHGIGQRICECACGRTCCIDIRKNAYSRGDIADEELKANIELARS